MSLTEYFNYLLTEYSNNILLNFTYFLSSIAIFMIVYYYSNKKNDDIINIMIILFILIVISLFTSVLNTNLLINTDNILLTKPLIFSTKIFNDDNNLITYQQKSILNLDYKGNYLYDVTKNIIIGYNYLTNNHNFGIKGVQYEVLPINNIPISTYLKYTQNYVKLLNIHNLVYDGYNKSYYFTYLNIVYVIIQFDNNKWVIFKNDIDNETYQPYFMLYYSNLYNYYRLIQFNYENIYDTTNCLCKLTSIGPEYLVDVNVNRYYTFYGYYSSTSEVKDILKIILSVLLPLTFSNKLKQINYKNNFK